METYNNLTKYKTKEGWFFVTIEEPSKEQIDKYYTTTGDIKSSTQTASTPRVFKKAIIVHTCSNKEYPVESEWIMGEAPGMKINFFGEKLIAIQEKDLYARINSI